MSWIVNIKHDREQPTLDTDYVERRSNQVERFSVVLEDDLFNHLQESPSLTDFPYLEIEGSRSISEEIAEEIRAFLNNYHEAFLMSVKESLDWKSDQEKIKGTIFEQGGSLITFRLYGTYEESSEPILVLGESPEYWELKPLGYLSLGIVRDCQPQTGVECYRNSKKFKVYTRKTKCLELVTQDEF
jgi:hypothetical protein